jgi:uncharacterized protein YaaR (DUF327 family)
VERINDQLGEMAEHFFDEKKQAVELLAKIGEIQGLLVNLYR